MEGLVEDILKRNVGEIEFSDILKIIENENSKLLLLNELKEFIKNEEKYYEEAIEGIYETFYPIHLIFILAEMNVDISEHLVGWMKNIDEEKVQFWFGDILSEELWYVFYKLIKNNFDNMRNYVLDVNINERIRGSILNGFYRLEIEEKTKHQDIVDIVKEIISNEEEGFDIRGMAINLGLNINAIEIKKEIKKAAKEIDDEQFYVSSDELEFGENWETDFYSRGFEELYEEFKVYSQNREEDDEMDYNEYMEGMSDYFENENEDIFEPRKSNKVGRNEPCLCGSGKKYKKCCGK